MASGLLSRSGRILCLTSGVFLIALAVLGGPQARGESPRANKRDTLNPAALGESQYQELKAKGLLPQPTLAPPPSSMRPENVISPEAKERTGALLIPLDETFTLRSNLGNKSATPGPRAAAIEPRSLAQ